MTLVVDASVALKWVLEEDNSDAARKIPLTDQLIAPELLLIECANSLWAKARSQVLSRGEASAAFAKLVAAPVRLRTEASLISAAQSIAFEIDCTVYDSLYLALAIAENAVLVTADNRFVRAVEAHPVYRAFVRGLSA